MTLIERRKHPGVPVLLECRIEGALGRGEMRLSDLSLGGCFIDTTMEFPENAHVTLFVTIGGTEVRFTGRVVHMQRGHGCGLAIAFDSDQDEARQKLTEFLRQQQQQQ